MKPGQKRKSHDICSMWQFPNETSWFGNRILQN